LSSFYVSLLRPQNHVKELHLKLDAAETEMIRQTIWEEIWHMVVTFMPKLGTSVLVLLGFWILSYVVRRIIVRISQSNRVDPDLIFFLKRIAKYTIWLIGIATAAGTLGIDVTTFAAGLGVTGFALGYAMKDTVSNVVSGMMVIAYKPFKRNDYIEMAARMGHEGRVKGIDLRYTVLEKDDGDLVYIPNSALFNNVVVVKNDDEEKEELRLSAQAIER